MNGRTIRSAGGQKSTLRRRRCSSGLDSAAVLSRRQIRAAQQQHSTPERPEHQGYRNRKWTVHYEGMDEQSAALVARDQRCAAAVALLASTRLRSEERPPPKDGRP